MGHDPTLGKAEGPPPKKQRLEDAASTSSSPLASPSNDRDDHRTSVGKGGKGGRGRGRGGGKRGRGNQRAIERPDRKVGWTEQEASAKRAAEGAEKVERRPKRKVVLYVGYCGTAYSGLQINKNVKTIEGTLYECLVRAGCISEDNADDPLKVGLHRAARTDAGVHAAINMLSLKLILDPQSMAADTTIEDHLNAYLPADIRVWRVSRVQTSFNPRTLCDARTYRYLFPSYLLLPPKPGSAMARKLASLAGPDGLALLDTWNNHDASQSAEDEMRHRRAWRAPAALLDRLKSLLACFTGSHNFHNFTVGTAFADRSATRVVRAADVRNIEVRDGTEWITVELHGQSFMLHQIRKMIGLLILTCRSSAPASLIPELYGPIKVVIPRAPAIGLRLERPHFDRYNRKVVDTPQARDQTEARSELDFPSDLLERVETWAEANIEPKMRDDQAFADWLQGLDENVQDELDYLNSQGIIPTKGAESMRISRSLEGSQGDEDSVKGARDELEG